MDTSWTSKRDAWLKQTSLESETSSWAAESINKSEEIILDLEKGHNSSGKQQRSIEEAETELRLLRKTIKRSLTDKENELDELSLNTPNSYKLQLSVPSNLSYLMKAWAAAEGRDLSSVAMQCLETGLREMKRKGSIPEAAVKRYDASCEKRIALAEVNHIWETHEQELIKKRFLSI